MRLTFSLEVKDFILSTSRKHPSSPGSGCLFTASRGETLGIHEVFSLWHAATCLTVSLSTPPRASQRFKKHTAGRLGLHGTGGFENLANLSASFR